MTKCLIECLITYFYYLTDDVVVCLFCHLPDVYRELLEPSLINRVLILDCPFNSYEPGLPTVLHLIFTFKIDRSFLYLRSTPIRLVSGYIQYTRYPQRWPRRNVSLASQNNPQGAYGSDTNGDRDERRVQQDACTVLLRQLIRTSVNPSLLQRNDPKWRQS